MYTLIRAYITCVFATFVENALMYSILSAFNPIQKRTCIKFKWSRLDSFNTPIPEKFVVVFSSHGNRFVLYNV